jgi:tripartite-type tricarboxylate transporter receptor subunit TctC
MPSGRERLDRFKTPCRYGHKQDERRHERRNPPTEEPNMRIRNAAYWLGALAGAGALVAAVAGPVHAADNYPSRAIDFIVPFEPGGSTDNFARTLGAYVTKKWNVPVNIINKPGGKGIPQTQELYRAAPDGYTILADNPSTSTMLAAARGGELPFDMYKRSFLGMVSGTAFTVIVAPDSPYKTMAELMAAAKANPEKMSYTSQGSAGMPDYFIRMVFNKDGIDINKAPPVMVTGSGTTVTMTAGGHVAIGLTSASGGLSAVQSGLVRALIISTKDPDPSFPGVPTSGELGYPTAVSWNGVVGPPAMPQNIKDKWAGLIKEATSDPEFIASLRKVGAAPYYMDSKQTEEFVRNETAQVTKLFSATN